MTGRYPSPGTGEGRGEGQLTFTKEPSVIEQKAYRDTWGRGLDSYLQWFYETVVLLREGLDLPEVSLVAILDADKEGFLRSTSALIQTIGRAARPVNGQIIMYADQTTEAMRQAIEETNRRRQIQMAHNREHGIVPASIIKELEKQMKTAAQNLGFEKAAMLRDQILELRRAMSDAEDIPEWERFRQFERQKR